MLQPGQTTCIRSNHSTAVHNKAHTESTTQGMTMEYISPTQLDQGQYHLRANMDNLFARWDQEVFQESRQMQYFQAPQVASMPRDGSSAHRNQPAMLPRFRHGNDQRNADEPKSTRIMKPTPNPTPKRRDIGQTQQKKEHVQLKSAASEPRPRPGNDSPQKKASWSAFLSMTSVTDHERGLLQELIQLGNPESDTKSSRL